MSLHTLDAVCEVHAECVYNVALRISPYTYFRGHEVLVLVFPYKIAMHLFPYS